mgnify:CR=1 FL=1
MKLKINSSYATPTGFIIPRSRMSGGKGEQYCIVQILTGGVTHYTSKHTTMNTKELRKALNLSQKERIEIL